MWQQNNRGSDFQNEIFNPREYIQYPQQQVYNQRQNSNNFQQLPNASEQNTSTGTVTSFRNEFGLINEKVFFRREACRGPLPQLGDRVLFQAIYSEGQGRWIASGVQLLSTNNSNYGNNGGNRLSYEPRFSNQKRTHTSSSSNNRPSRNNHSEGYKKMAKSNTPSNAGKSRNNRSKRRSVNLPELGQPGGYDDPLRRGLSGAGTRWYLRYLDQGLAPEEARNKAEEHRKIPKEEKPASPEKRDNGATSTSLSTKDAGQTDADDSAKTHIRVVILPAEYPKVSLTAAEQNSLEDAIIDEVALGWENKIQFESIQFQPGMILVNCETQETADWLKNVTPKLNSWKGAPLTTCTENEMPIAHTITILLPQSAGQDHGKALTLIEAQNVGLNTHSWKILNCTVKGKGQLLTIAIDDASAQKIIEENHCVRYRFEKIPICGLKTDSADESNEEVTLEEGTNLSDTEEQTEIESAENGN